jgi:hypothetical protein
VADTGSNRVLIWKSIPTYGHPPARRVLGQKVFTSIAPVTVTLQFLRSQERLDSNKASCSSRTRKTTGY